LPVAAPQKESTSPSPANQPTAAQIAQPSVNWWNSLKERARYWILLAQLNPLPVAIGAAVLLFLIALLVLQRRRAKGTRRVRRVDSKKVAATTTTSATSSRAETNATPKVSPAEVAMMRAAVAGPIVADNRHERVTRVSEEVKKTLAGGDYSEAAIASNDPATRQLVSAELLSALVGRNLQRRQRARDVFMKHGYFDDATRDLRSGESPNERAAAARRLSFLHERDATPHLIGALDDSSPEVRRAAVEALGDLRDPAAIGPLNSLMQTETDRNVPRMLIKHAIDSCATATSENREGLTSAPAPAATDREVIEI